MLRPLNAADRPALSVLAGRAAATHRLPNPDELPVAWTTSPSGGEVHLLGQWHGEQLLAAAVRATPSKRPRCRHLTQLDLLVAPGVDARPALAAMVSLLHDWTPVDRLQLDLPADHPALVAATSLGFLPEVTRRRRLPDGSDEIALGWLRPGFLPRPPVGPPPWPDRRPPPAVRVDIRPTTEADVEAIRALSVEPTAVWGTLQVPTSSHDFYLQRHQLTPHDHRVFLLLVDGRPAGIGGVHPTGLPEVLMIGMMIDLAWQGCGLGRQLMDHLMHVALVMGARRVELGVWEDNTRARRLYETSGFVAEGVRRYDAIRAGGHASSLEMALIVRG